MNAITTLLSLDLDLAPGRVSTKRLALLLYALSAAFLALAAAFVWYGWLEPPYLSYRNMPFAVVGDVKAGAAVELKVTRCSTSHQEEVYLITRRLIRVDRTSEDVILGSASVPIDPGCHDEVSAVNVIPPLTAPGSYLVRGRAKVDGSFRASSVGWESQPFKVVP